ncbi:MAG: nucleoside deaminase [Ilumatobacteraceae bacterium]
MPVPTNEELVRRSCDVAARARAAGNQPFGSLLVGPDGEVLLEAENTVVTARDATGHAETNLVRDASVRFDEARLRTCTLVSSTEPCAMCAGAIYWSGISHVVFGLSEAVLRVMAGAVPTYPTMALPCRVVFASGSRRVTVSGPVDIAEARAVHDGFWSPVVEV